MQAKPLAAGFLFGLLAPLLGLFIGLQLSPLLANILMFPIIMVSVAVDVPLGEMSGWLWAALMILSGFVWAAVFGTLSLLVQKATGGPPDRT